MLDKDKQYTFLIDRTTRRPACVLLQAVYGFDSAPCHVFKEWELAPTSNFVRVTATGEEIESFARKTNA